MKSIVIPKGYNYIGVFLTLDCNYKCSYCINDYSTLNKNRRHLSCEEWIKALNRIKGNVPVTLQGGEPSLYADFIYIINNLKPELDIDILTNLQFDIDEFIKAVNPNRIKRNSPYASIRVSFHPEAMNLKKTLTDVCKLLDKGYSVGIWGLLHPAHKSEIMLAKEKSEALGIDFRTKEFLGFYKGKLYGTYRYESACNGRELLKCECRTTELLIAPDGHIYQCHSYLYNGYDSIGHILDDDFQVEYKYRPCNRFGQCNPCDIKIKTNRFQEYGHTSVSIKNIQTQCVNSKIS